MRRVLKKIANNEKDLGDISTMADSSVVEVRYINIINLCIREANQQVIILQVLFKKREEMMASKGKK